MIFLINFKFEYEKVDREIHRGALKFPWNYHITIGKPFGSKYLLEFGNLGLAQWTFQLSPNKSQRPIWAWESVGVVQIFSPTLLVEVEDG